MSSLAGPVAGQPHPSSGRKAPATGVGPARRVGRPVRRHPRTGYETASNVISRSSLARRYASFRFYAELNDFLPAVRKQVAFDHPFDGCPGVKDLIEAIGVPHTEVNLILVDGRSVDFDHRVQDGARISVYPVFESIDIGPITQVRPTPLRETRFVLDVHLGRLCKYLRLAGFDTLYRRDYHDAELAAISSREGRILLTRDETLLKRKIVTRGYCVRHTAPRDQVVEVLQRFDLFDRVTPFCRCLTCNGTLQRVSKDEILDRLPPRTRQHYDVFHICRDCSRIYWSGSHYLAMSRFLDDVLAGSRRDLGSTR